MVILRGLLLAASIASTLAAPGFDIPTFDINTIFHLPTLTTPLGNNHAETARTEPTFTALNLPDFSPPNNNPAAPSDNSPGYTPSNAQSTASRAHPRPQTAHEEAPVTQLLLPTLVNSGGSHAANDAGNNAAQVTSPSDSGARNSPVYAPQNGVASNGLIVPVQAQAAASTVSLFTSAGTVYSMTVAVTPPAFLTTTQPGAIGIAAGSAVTIGGTTYSVAPGGTAVYVNGRSNALTGTAFVQGPGSYTTSGSVVFSNGVQVTGGPTAKAMASPTSPASPSGTTNAGNTLSPAISGATITLGLMWIAFL